MNFFNWLISECRCTRLLSCVTQRCRHGSSRVVYINGEVSSPGAYPLTGPMTVVQLLAVAGGLSEWANERNIRIMRADGGYRMSTDFPRSIGPVRAFYGNFGMLVRAYAYMVSLGGDGMRRATQMAVLNANYIRKRLEGVLELAYEGPCLHECVFSDSKLEPLGVKTLDLAKRLLDFGFHPPTIYFPLLVDEALMVEPTETETAETLDAFAEAIEAILAEAESDPEVARKAPYTTPVRRLDEAAANRRPVVRQPAT